MQAKLNGSQAATAEQLQRLRAETEAVSQELQKAQDRASRVMEDVIGHIHSPNFSQQVTAGFGETLEALQHEVQELKTKAEVSQLQVMEGVRRQRVETVAEADTAAKAPTPLQAAPVEVTEVGCPPCFHRCLLFFCNHHLCKQKTCFGLVSPTQMYRHA